jgi:hypothetical protein
MRMLMVFLIVLGAVYNNGVLSDGAMSMLRDIDRSIR